jgi:hypothetical protein
MKFILSVEKSINSFVCVSIVIILSNDLWWHELPEIFNGGGKLLAFIYNVATGYLVSYIFYLVVVRYKEYKNESHINSIVIPLLEEIVKSQTLVNDCIKGIDPSENLDINDKQSFNNLLSRASFSDNIPSVSGTFLYAPARWSDFLDGQKNQTRKNTQRAFAFISHLEPVLIKLLTSIDNSDLFISLIFVSKFNDKQREQTMGDISGPYFNYNQHVNDLSLYIENRKTA